MPTFRESGFVLEEVKASGSELLDQMLWISDAGQLTQFGAFIEVLQPGSRSAREHWHSSEDELVYVLDGDITVVEGKSETVLRTGDAATFKAGVPVAHNLVNRGLKPTKCLILGTRARQDKITYPDLDRVCHRDRDAETDTWTDSAGNPAQSPHEKPALSSSGDA